MGSQLPSRVRRVGTIIKKGGCVRKAFVSRRVVFFMGVGLNRASRGFTERAACHVESEPMHGDQVSTHRVTQRRTSESKQDGEGINKGWGWHRDGKLVTYRGN